MRALSNIGLICTFLLDAATGDAVARLAALSAAQNEGARPRVQRGSFVFS